LQKGLKLKVKSGYVEYKWRKDTKTSTVLRTTDTFTVFTPGRYWIYVKDSFGCNKHDSIRIYANDPIFDLGANDTACDQYTLCADTIKFPNYKHKWQKKNNTSGVWSTIGYSNCITITDSGINWIKLTQYSQPDSCYFTDSIKIVIKKATKIHCSGLGPFCANDSNNYFLRK
ncbi:MAG: hypothetical protein NTX03_08075, partial [Bacteroidetes bacterium]|nr:hypothetical protein [Bacteroidota bacterium]